MSGLGALADLEFDHLDLIVGGDAGEFLWVERAVPVAAAEIAGADFPDDVAAILAVIGADAALAGVMGEAAFFGAGIQRAHGIGTERAETHRGDVEDRGRIRLGAIWAANGDAKLPLGTRLPPHRMVNPFIALAIYVFLGSECSLLWDHR